MTREDAKKALATSWCFERRDDYILLRDVSLVEAVTGREAERPFGTAPVTTFGGAQAPRPA